MARGLAALPQEAHVRQTKVEEHGYIPPEDIEFDLEENGRQYPPSKVAEMAVLLLEHGQEQPIRLRTNPETGKKRLTFGFRRVLAGLEINKNKLTDKVFKLRYELVEESTEEARISNYIENIGREDLTLVDHILNLSWMQDVRGMKQVDIARSINRSRGWVSQVLNCSAKFTGRAMKAIADGRINVELAFELAHMSEEKRAAEIEAILTEPVVETDSSGGKKRKKKKVRGSSVLTGKAARQPFLVEVQGQQEEGGKLDSWGAVCNYMVKYMSGEVDFTTLKRNVVKRLAED